MIQCLHAGSASSHAQSGESNAQASLERPASIKELCVLLEVSRSGYYDHLHKAEGSRRTQDLQLIEKIAAHRKDRGSLRGD